MMKISARTFITVSLLSVLSITIVASFVLPSVFEQKIYAPMGGRGVFAKDMPIAVREGDGACKGQSDFSICTCDFEQMQKAIDSYNKVHGVV